MALIVQCISHRDDNICQLSKQHHCKCSVTNFFFVMFSLASFHLFPLYFWPFSNYGTSFIIVTAPAFFARKKVLHITYGQVAEGKKASIMNDIKAILALVTLAGSSCFLSNSISYFVIYIINEECLVIFNKEYFVLLPFVTYWKVNLWTEQAVQRFK